MINLTMTDFTKILDSTDKKVFVVGKKDKQGFYKAHVFEPVTGFFSSCLMAHTDIVDAMVAADRIIWLHDTTTPLKDNPQGNNQ